MYNGIILLLIVVLVIVIKFIILTIRIHQHNLKIQDKLGKDVYNWMISDGKPLPPPIKLELSDLETALKLTSIKLEQLGKSFQGLNKPITLTIKSFKEFGIKISEIRMEQNEF